MGFCAQHSESWPRPVYGLTFTVRKLLFEDKHPNKLGDHHKALIDSMRMFRCLSACWPIKQGRTQRCPLPAQCRASIPELPAVLHVRSRALEHPAGQLICWPADKLPAFCISCTLSVGELLASLCVPIASVFLSAPTAPARAPGPALLPLLLIALLAYLICCSPSYDAVWP